MKSYSLWAILMCGILLLTLAGCGSKPEQGAAGAVEGYLSALMEKDANKLSNISCASWEPQARLELDSFAAVKANLKDVKCQDNGKDGNMTLVSCTGKIVANYNGEDQELDLQNRAYQATQEGGEWRMCGYK